ncbi:hypothetical protein DFH07DRAFT_763717 [Mycena maculata]|uniref:Uncharacterized protein n=1 Tax=Mycena maculata TaxID=230809 RepID=A0AAD7P2J7_9AGAR|nr:hypothetical protein DFH07DRAFT_763717 [Mycena maculata]
MEQLERRYDPADLARLKRSDLVALVQRQLEKWPTQTLGKFRPQKTNMDIMKTALTSANSQFTNNKPAERPASPIVDNLWLPPPRPPSPGPSERPAPGVITPQSLSEYRSILLLVEDTRSIGEKVSHRVRVSVINPENAATGEWQASSQEIVDELQASIAAFRGPARIGISDPENPGYTIFLATITGPEYQANDAPSSPILVDVPQSGTLKLTVSHIGGLLLLFVFYGAAKRLQSESLPDTKGELSASTQVNIDPQSLVSSSKKKKSITEALTEKELTWITEKAQSTAGFDEFKLNQNRRLSNSERVRYWRFAAAFSTTYYKAQWPRGIELSGGKSVKKNAIKAALGMETTMLTQALNMAKIVGIYYDGPHRSSEVVESRFRI